MKKASKQMLYRVTVGEGCCCGPAFGPSSAMELFEIAADKGPGSVILQMQESVAYNNESLSFIVVTPRYIGETLNLLRTKGCIVDIARVLPDRLDQLRKGNVDGSTEYLAVGDCRPI